MIFIEFLFLISQNIKGHMVNVISVKIMLFSFLKWKQSGKKSQKNDNCPVQCLCFMKSQESLKIFMGCSAV